MGQPLIFTSLYEPRKEKASCVDGRLDDVALYILKALGVRYEVGGAFYALNNNGP